METLRLKIEKQGHAGKTVTIIEGFTREKRLMKALVSNLKKELGTGGSFKDRTVLLQGDIREQLRPLLLKAGFTVKG